MEKLINEIDELNEYICIRLNDLTALKKHILERCHCALYKILNSESELNFSVNPIEVSRGKSVVKILKNDDGKYIVQIFWTTSRLYNEYVHLDSFTDDEEIRLTKAICERFLKENNPTLEYERLKKILLEKMELAETFISYVGNVGADFRGLPIDFVGRIGKFVHLYDGDPSAPNTKEIIITDKSCWCNVVRKIIDNIE